MNEARIENHIPKFKTIVIKCGGSIINDELNNLIENIAQLIKMEYKVILVHGGGNDIKALSDALNLKSNFINGLRVTTSETLEVAKMVLLGKNNVNLVHKLNTASISALGLSGHDINLLVAEYIDQENLGFVGEIKQVNTSFLNLLLEQGIVPVVAPLAIDNSSNTLNINADLAASKIAASIGADKLLLLTDVDGLYTNYADKNSLVSLITDIELNALLKHSNEINGGMIPKLNACIEAVNDGVNSAHIINGQHNFLEAITDINSIGTKITKGVVSC